MSDLSARLDLPLIKPSQAQKHVTHNEALQILDGLVQAVIEETGAETPPFEPVEGQLFALGPNPTGDWAGEGGKLALRGAGAWLFLTPREGWRAWDRAAGRIRVHDGAAWVDLEVDLDNLAGVGIGTTSDATNRLAVASPASLFTHEGAGHRVKVNKAADTDTASLLFQSGFTGHAEMGLAGGNDWSIKVSPDGSIWTEALVIDSVTGLAYGAAVQQNSTDTTPGRLLKIASNGTGPFGLGPKSIQVSDFNDAIENGFYYAFNGSANAPPGSINWSLHVVRTQNSNNIAQVAFSTSGGFIVYSRSKVGGTWEKWHRIIGTSNLVGTVSNDGDGDPDGAVFERGSNSNGEYVRFADGTQMCWLTDTTDSANNTTQAFPAAFVDTTYVMTVTPNPGTAGRRFVEARHNSNTTAVYNILDDTGARVAEEARLFAVGRWF